MVSMSFRGALAFGLLGTFAACTATTTGTGQPSSSSSSSSSSTSSSGSPLNADECNRRCTQKALSCDVPSDQVDGVCARVCDGSYTTAQIACMELKPCAELEAASSLAALCPATSSSSSSSGSVGRACTDELDCSGIGPCRCKDGQSLSTASWQCLSSACVPDCSFACQSHGGV